MAPHSEQRRPAKIRGEDFERLLRDELPRAPRFHFEVEDIAHGFARIRLAFDEGQLRPGGTIGGPVIFTLADTALYAAVMSAEGMSPLAVTTDMNVHFLRKPRPVDLIAEARLLKRGRKLVVGEVLITSDGASEPVAHVTGTYVLPS